MRSNAIFTPEGYPRRNPALPLASVVTTACESVPRFKPALSPSWWMPPNRSMFETDAQWKEFLANAHREEARTIYSVFN